MSCIDMIIIALSINWIIAAEQELIIYLVRIGNRRLVHQLLGDLQNMLQSWGSELQACDK